jgi:uncharacterized protein
MKWIDRGMSGNVEDRRGGMVRMGTMGIGGTIVLLLLSVVFKRDFFSMFGQSGPTAATEGEAPKQNESPEEKKLVGFVSFVLDDVQDEWAKKLPQYRPAKLVLFEGAVRSGCGDAQSATGPFYCPADERVYIDLGFYRELKQRFGAPGDFAQAYVLAHEVGHHLQNVLGTEKKLRSAQRQDPAQRNALSVRMELQADCYAGMWAKATDQRQLLEAGDVEEGMAAAAAVGDDRLQKGATGRVMPERWTHGSSAQRVGWFQRGYQAGTLDACDSFAATTL